MEQLLICLIYRELPTEITVWTCGYSDDYDTSALIKIKDGVVEKVFEGLSNGQSNGYYVGPMSGVWSDNEYRVFMMNGAEFTYNKITINFSWKRR